MLLVNRLQAEAIDWVNFRQEGSVLWRSEDAAKRHT